MICEMICVICGNNIFTQAALVVVQTLVVPVPVFEVKKINVKIYL